MALPAVPQCSLPTILLQRNFDFAEESPQQFVIEAGGRVLPSRWSPGASRVEPAVAKVQQTRAGCVNFAADDFPDLFWCRLLPLLGRIR
jgi:hypothetical protein